MQKIPYNLERTIGEKLCSITDLTRNTISVNDTFTSAKLTDN